MVGQAPLERSIQVRILAPQPSPAIAPQPAAVSSAMTLPRFASASRCTASAGGVAIDPGTAVERESGRPHPPARLP